MSVGVGVTTETSGLMVGVGLAVGLAATVGLTCTVGLTVGLACTVGGESVTVGVGEGDSCRNGKRLAAVSPGWLSQLETSNPCRP